jgi:chaperonin GroES
MANKKLHEDFEEQEIEQEDERIDLPTLLDFIQMGNVAEALRDTELDLIGRDAVEGYEIDDASREEWLKKSEKAMVAVEKKWAGGQRHMSNVKYPSMILAALMFHSKAYPAIVSGNTVVKGKVIGKDHDNIKEDRAKRVSAHMNYQLLEQMPEWEEQTDKILLALPIEGCEFRKVYYDDKEKRNVSVWIRPKDFIVHNDTISLETCPRITQVFELYPYQIRQRQLDGTYRDVELHIHSDEDKHESVQKMIEQHVYLDVDEDGTKEPWILTVHLDSKKVLRMVSAIDPNRSLVSIGANRVSMGIAAERGMLENAKIYKFEREDYYTKYPFIPSPDGSFYDIGYGQLIGALTDTIDTLLNQIVDSGTLANLGGGFYDMVYKLQKKGDLLFKIGEFKPIRVPAGKSIRDMILHVQHPGPNQYTLATLDLLLNAVSEIVGTNDVMSGDVQQNAAPTVVLAAIEQGIQKYSAIYKRVYRALKFEFKQHYRLNALYLEPVEYFTILDESASGQIEQTDYQNDETDISPVSDPRLATTSQKMAKAQFLGTFIGPPNINTEEIQRRQLEAADIEGIDKILIPKENIPEPPPDPIMVEVESRAIKARAEAAKILEQVEETRAKTLKAIAEAEAAEKGSNLAEYKAVLEGLKLESIRSSNSPGAQPVGRDGGNKVPLQTP